MKKDLEWDAFVDNNEHFVDPRLPIRKAERIIYPGKEAPAAAEVRSGMLERKSKYLKSYTPGWYVIHANTLHQHLLIISRYVLSATHLHEFKSADNIKNQSPVMSLYLPEQKLGSHSNVDSSSHKFMLKGRQAGGMHRGHGWVFRAESRDTMLAWYEDIKSLTEKTGEERTAFVRRHARSVSGGSHKAGSVSSDGAMEEDEADEVPYSGKSSHFDHEPPVEAKLPERPQTVRGRFPSDLNVNRDLHVPLSPSSGTSSDDREEIRAAGSLLPSSSIPFGRQSSQVHSDRQFMDSESHGVHAGEYDDEPGSSEVHPMPKTPSRQPTYQSSKNKERLDLGARALGPVTPGTDVNSLGPAEAVNRSRSPSAEASYQMLQEDGPSPLEQISPRANADAMQEGSSVPNVQRIERTNLPVIEGSYHAMPRTSYFPMQEDQTIPQPSQATAPVHGAEYQIQPVESHGIGSEGPGAVAYATQQFSESTRDPTLPTPSKSPGPLSEQPYSMGTGVVWTKADVDEEKPSPQPAEAPRSLLEPSQTTSAPQPQPATTPQGMPNPALVESPVQTPAPAATPQVELSQFGSTPKVDNPANFDTSFAAVLPVSIRALKKIEAEREQEDMPPLRPKVTSQSSVSTISDLHVPGEFPRGSR